MWLRAYLGDNTGLAPDDRKKEYRSKEVKQVFCFPVHTKITFTLYYSLLSVQQHNFF